MRKVATATILALTLASAGGHGNVSASPNFLIDNPIRPADSRLLLATTGIFLKYELIATDAMLSPRITILDEVSRQPRTFSMSFDTSINGQRLTCANPRTSSLNWVPAQQIARYDLCRTLPATFQPGQTRVTILYWPHVSASPPDALRDFDTEPATDALWVINP